MNTVEDKMSTEECQKHLDALEKLDARIRERTRKLIIEANAPGDRNQLRIPEDLEGHPPLIELKNERMQELVAYQKCIEDALKQK